MPPRASRPVGPELALAAAAALVAALVVASWDDRDARTPAAAQVAAPRPVVRVLPARPAAAPPVVAPVSAAPCDALGGSAPVRASMGADATGCQIVSTTP